MRIILSRLACCAKSYTPRKQFSSDIRPLLPKKSTAPGHTKKRFVDFQKVRVKGGNGGDGCMTFSSLPRNEWAGPDGGDGGNGGHVILLADEDETCLEKVPHVLNATDGVRGKSRNRFGKNADHLYMKVPIGTLVKNEDSRILSDLQRHGEMYIAARGGAGGRGNRFYLSNENRAPTVYEEGAKGEERTLLVELRIMAHAGLVGFPNAGKSTLLRAMSRARPKVAAYPFTTLNPHVGMVQYEDLMQLAVADIPGLIRGAHLNYGLGFSFLRHIERCSCLLYVIDLTHDEPWTQLEDLKFELEQYAEGLSQRPHAIVANKIDMPLTARRLEELRTRLENEGRPIFGVSAKEGEGIYDLLVYLRELYYEFEESKRNEGTDCSEDVIYNEPTQ